MNFKLSDIENLKAEGKIRGFSSIDEYRGAFPVREEKTPEPRRRKYGNHKVVVNGIEFDSKKEARVYGDLMLREKAGEISGLELQKEYPLEVNGILVCKYVADFVYRAAGGAKIVVDVKSAITRKNRAYRIKVKLMRAVYGIEIVEL